MTRGGRGGWLVALALVGAGCGGGGGGGNGGDADCVTIESVTLGSASIALGAYTSCDVAIHNACAPRTGFSVQNWITQGSAELAAGGRPLACNGGSWNGNLPAGDCLHNGLLTVENGGAGTGVLVAGPATAVIELRSNVEGLVVSKTVPITIQ